MNVMWYMQNLKELIITMKTISYYVGEFFLAVLIFFFAVILMLQCTIFQENFMAKEIEKSNFIRELYQTTEEEFSYYILQSGLSEEVVAGLVSESEMKEVLLEYLHNFYEGNSLTIPTDDIKTKLEANIINYLNQNNLTVSDEASLDLFVEEILNTYQKNMEDSFLFGRVQTLFVKIKQLLPTILIVLGITIVLIFLLLRFGLKKNSLGIPCFTSGALFLLFYLYVCNSLDMQNFYVYNEAFSNLMKSIYSSICSNMLAGAVILFVLGVFATVFGSFFGLQKKKKSVKQK